MKPIKLFLVLLCISNLLINCGTSNDENSVNQTELLNRFFSPKVNVYENIPLKLKYTTDLYTSQDLKVIQEKVIDKLVPNKFYKIGGTAIYYKNHSSTYSKDDILALSIYELSEKNIMMHHFYLKSSDGTFHKKLSLLENRMATANINFLVEEFLQQFLGKTALGISLSRDLNLTPEVLSSQRNEFDLRRVVQKYKTRMSRLSRVGVRGDDCRTGCAEVGDGLCDSGLWCDVGAGDDGGDDGGGGPICDDEHELDDSVERGILSQTVANSLFDLDLHRRLRDELMSQYNIGEKYIDYYYVVCQYFQKEDYATSTLIKIISTLPRFNEAITKLLDQAYSGTDIIIDEQLYSDMVSIITDMRNATANLDIHFILTELENDLSIIKNKSKGDILITIN